MVRVVTQETYDEVVKENIDEFLMSPEDAIEDAVKQFEAQGVDLANIIKDLVISNDPEIVQNSLKDLSNGLESKNFRDVPSILDKLQTELDKDMARRILAAKHNAYSTLIHLIKETKNDQLVLRAAIKTILALMNGYPDLLDEKGISLQIELFDDLRKDVTTVQLLLKWVRVCCLKHEVNRQNIFAAGIFDRLKSLLERDEITGSELKDICAVLRALVLDDDIRHEYGKAHEHATGIARDSLGLLTSLLPKFRDDESIVGDLMLTLASLIVRNEFCQTVDEAGGLQFILDVMVDYPEAEKLNRQALKLLKALAGNDDVKSHIVTSGGVPLITSVISRLKSYESIASAGMACISALALRSPSNAGVFYDCGGPLVIVDTIKAHQNSVNVIRQGSWAVRNMSVRNQTESKEFLNHGIEDLMLNAIRKHGQIIEEDVKAALRDLGLEVKLKERWVGKGGSLSNDFN